MKMPSEVSKKKVLVRLAHLAQPDPDVHLVRRLLLPHLLEILSISPSSRLHKMAEDSLFAEPQNDARVDRHKAVLVAGATVGSHPPLHQPHRVPNRP